MPKLELTDEEIALLDGRVSPETQSTVDAAKQRLAMMRANSDLSPKLAELITKAVREAMKNGILVHQYTNVHYCSLCEKSAGYALHTRNGKYHRKGQEDTRKPRSFRGFELQKSFVFIKGHVSLGGCLDCYGKVINPLREALATIRAELPSELAGPVKFKRWDDYECPCGWKGHEGQLLQLRTFMGDGYYRGKCPKCGKENQLFSQPIKRLSTFTIVEVENAKAD